ncbi:MAG: tyrosine-type recombinase/integrase [Hyphomicrobiales bacterium]|nr:tyrosine-type recombinase/integrase [Hyphomicrobiales bacterium]
MRGAKRPRLWLRKARRDKRTGAVRPATWIILHRGRHIATGCLEREVEGADRALHDYIARSYAPSRRAASADAIAVADVLSLYVDEALPRVSDPDKLLARIERLNRFWQNRRLGEVTGATCREYAEWRGARAASRRELEDLRAAIKYHAKEGLHREIIMVSLPEKGQPRDRWLTRAEAADLLWICWRYREVQTLHRGPMKGERVQTGKYPLRHLAKFILIGIYTGTRAGAIAAASPAPAEGRSWVDLDRGVFYRLAIGRKATRKRQPPVRLPDRLLAHMRRWARMAPAQGHFVEWRGKPVRSVKTGFGSAVDLAGLEGRVSPHTLRHTAATWLMQAGASLWEAAGFLGMSEKVLRDVYGHHHPDFQREAADALGYGKRVSLAQSLADDGERKARIKAIIGGPGRTRTCNQIVMSAAPLPESSINSMRNGVKFQ